MKTEFLDLVLTLRVHKDPDAPQDERFTTGFDEYPSLAGIGRTPEESLSNFGSLLGEIVGTELKVKSLKRAVQRAEARRARRSARRMKRAS